MKSKKLFPEKIGEYRFMKILDKEGIGSSFCFGQYRDNRGKLYICKLWYGKKRNLKYSWINNEIASYKLLSSLYLDNKKEIDSYHFNVTMPEVHYVSKKGNKVYFLMDKAQGVFLGTKPVKVLYDSYIHIYEYFEVLSNLLPKTIHVAKRSPMHYMVLIHYYLILVSLKYPELLLTFVMSLPAIYKGFLQMSKDSRYSLVLRDLASESNIFINKEKLTIIDLESLTLTNKLVQVACTAIVECSNRKFVDFFFESDNIKKITAKPTSKVILKALLLYSSIVELVATHRTNKQLVKKEAMYVFNKALAL